MSRNSDPIVTSINTPSTKQLCRQKERSTAAKSDVRDQSPRNHNARLRSAAWPEIAPVTMLKMVRKYSHTAGNSRTKRVARNSGNTSAAISSHGFAVPSIRSNSLPAVLARERADELVNRSRLRRARADLESRPQQEAGAKHDPDDGDLLQIPRMRHGQIANHLARGAKITSVITSSPLKRPAMLRWLVRNHMARYIQPANSTAEVNVIAARCERKSTSPRIFHESGTLFAHSDTNAAGASDAGWNRNEQRS